MATKLTIITGDMKKFKFQGVEVFRMFDIDTQPKIAIYISRGPKSHETLLQIIGLKVIKYQLLGSIYIYCTNFVEIINSSCNI